MAIRAGVTNIGLPSVSITLGSRTIVAWSDVTTLSPMEAMNMGFVPVVPTGTPAVAVPVAKPNGKMAGQPTYADLKAKIAELEAKALIANAPGKLTIRINDAVNPETGVAGKGTVCVYGLGKFPVALYAEQWERLLTQDHVGTILQICKDPRASRKVR